MFVLQVTYAVREYARRAVDILARRTRMAFLNVHTAEEVLPRIIEIMSQELKWNKQKQKVPAVFSEKSSDVAVQTKEKITLTNA